MRTASGPDWRSAVSATNRATGAAVFWACAPPRVSAATASRVAAASLGMLLDVNMGTANGRECSTANGDAPVRKPPRRGIAENLTSFRRPAGS